jgi:4-hydroxythreonine-4-phosphate dehydrogenase
VTDPAGAQGIAVLILADDLSGATEVAAVIAPPGSARAEIVLTPAVPGPAAPVAAIDLDSRQLAPAAAADAMRAALRLPVARSATLVFAKVDSLLRGNLAATVAAVRESGRPTVLATALPAQHRSVRDGVLHLAGEPLHHTTAWAAEGAAPPRSVAAALAPVPVAVVPLTVIRGPALAAALAELLAGGAVPACDAETDRDLDAIVAAARTIPGVRLAGAGGLAAALGRALRLPPDGAESGERADAVLTVVGTAAPVAREQVRRLAAAGATRVRVPVTGLLEGRVDLGDLGAGSTVLTLESSADPVPADAPRIARSLATAVAGAVRSSPLRVDLVLTGGETARRILDALGIVQLTPTEVVHHGAVACRADDGRTVVTRPGSFGGPDSLVRIVQALLPECLFPTVQPTKGIRHV